jgi:hypothetical protein
VERKSFKSHLVVLVLLTIGLFPSVALAVGVIDRVEVLENKAKSEVDIYLYFLTNVSYVRHFPLDESDYIHIDLQFRGGPGGNRDFINSPPSKLIPPFEVNYPDRATNGIGFKFKKKVKYRVTPDSTGRGIIIHVAVDQPKETPAPKTEVKPVEKETPLELEKPKTEEPLKEPLKEPIKIEQEPSTPITKPESIDQQPIDAQTSILMADAKLAMQGKDYPKAIELINTVLNFPPHKYSEEAQELIGVAREENSEYKRAKAEYELYLKIYPEGKGVVRVKERLAKLEPKLNSQTIAAGPVKKERIERDDRRVFGSVNQYYYDANSRNNNPSPIEDNKTHDQSSLVSQINLTAKRTKNEYDGKFVVRHIETNDFLPGDNHQDRHRLINAYGEFEDHDLDYMVRLGRQNGNSGGILGRFDGGWFRYGFNPMFKVNLVGGHLDEYNVDYDRNFVGVNVDIAPAGGNFNSNLYFITQRTDGITDRRAVGTELRYFDQNKSMYSLLDYDTVFNQLNIGLIQANWQTENGINFNALYDHRKSPLIQAVNSLPVYFQFGATTLGQVLKQNLATKDQIYSDAKALTLDTDLYLFGATKQVTPKWQLGGDIRMNRSSGSAAAGDAVVAKAIRDAIEAGKTVDSLSFTSQLPQPGTGNIWTYTAQAVGSDTIFSNDTSVINVSYSESDFNKIYSSVLSNVVSPRPKWRIDSSLRLIKIDTEPSTKSTAIAPTIRLAYQVANSVTLECEVGLEWDTIDDATGTTKVFRDFSFVGYRWDF